MDAIGQMAGSIAHDFNNLLTAIVGNTTFLEDQLGRGHANYGEVREIRESANRAANLIRQLLAFARRQVLELRVLDLGAHVVQMQGVLRRLIEANIEIRGSRRRARTRQGRSDTARTGPPQPGCQRPRRNAQGRDAAHRSQ